MNQFESVLIKFYVFNLKGVFSIEIECFQPNGAFSLQIVFINSNSVFFQILLLGEFMVVFLIMFNEWWVWSSGKFLWECVSIWFESHWFLFF